MIRWSEEVNDIFSAWLSALIILIFSLVDFDRGESIRLEIVLFCILESELSRLLVGFFEVEAMLIKLKLVSIFSWISNLKIPSGFPHIHTTDFCPIMTRSVPSFPAASTTLPCCHSTNQLERDTTGAQTHQAAQVHVAYFTRLFHGWLSGGTKIVMDLCNAHAVIC